MSDDTEPSGTPTGDAANEFLRKQINMSNEHEDSLENSWRKATEGLDPRIVEALNKLRRGEISQDDYDRVHQEVYTPSPSEQVVGDLVSATFQEFLRGEITREQLEDFVNTFNANPNVLLQSQTDEVRETPFGPLQQEDVDTTEYARSLESLRRFLDIDVGKIKTIEDLSAKTSVVGHDLRTVILAKGEIQETRFGYTKPGEARPTKAIDRIYVIRKPVGDHTIFATTYKESAYMGAYVINRGQQLSTFNVRLPASSDITVTGEPIKDMQNVSAVDWRGGTTRSYYPAKEPNNHEVQQGFARVLKDGIRDVLSIMPLPAQVPPAFQS